MSRAAIKAPPLSDMAYGQAVFVVGLQYGDEGKGKIVDMLAAEVSAVARGNGGANAGHTIVLESGKNIALHQLPSGVAYKNTKNVIGHGVLADPVRLLEEIDSVKEAGCEISPANLFLSSMAHMVLPHHKVADAARESGGQAQGSTKAGIAYAASDKSLREGIRVEMITTKTAKELENIARDQLKKQGLSTDQEVKKLSSEFAAAAVKFKQYVSDTPDLLNNLLDSGKNILVEGAQAYGLDINHGKYPFTTSTGTTVPALIEGTGINPKRAGKVVGVAKATPSKVGGGSFVGKIVDDSVAESTRGKKGDVDGEYGATTGRQREVGYLDLVLLKRAIRINGADEIALTKFDCLPRHGATTKIVTSYEFNGNIIGVPPTNDVELALCRPIYTELPTWDADIQSVRDFNDLPETAQNYIILVEEELGIPISIIGVGPERDQIIVRSGN